MKKTLLFLSVAVCAFAANSVMTGGVALNAHPQPPAPEEFYWDDGIMTAGWAWYTGGNYWAVQFDDVKTGGDDSGTVGRYGAVTYAGWPDTPYQGVNIHTFSDVGGYPGADLGFNLLTFTHGSTFEWIDADPNVHLTTSVFYIAFQQIGNYPQCDSIGVDAVAGTHDWTGYQGSWAPTTANGDYLLRCYWGDYDAVTPTTWGAVKALY